MSTKFARHTRAPTPQTEPMPGRGADQAKNDAGGYAFKLDDWKRLERFLILGTEGGTYYASERAMTLKSAAVVERCIKENGPLTVANVVVISEDGRAPKNDPALFALAMCASIGDDKTREMALRALPRVARIGTHLFHFAHFVDGMRGWGPALRRAVGNWYKDRDVEDLCNQLVKYQQRDGWSHRDLLRKAHPKADNAMQAGAFNWVCRRKDDATVPSVLLAFDQLMANPGPEKAVEIIRREGFPRECVPTELLNDPDIWAALLPHMPMGAMVRNLGKMTAIGLLAPLSEANRYITSRLGDEISIRKARLHPLQVLLAARTYASGAGIKGSLKWDPVLPIADALETAFDLSFQACKPTGKRIMLCLDVSGSMGSQFGDSPLTCREGTAALALTIARREANYHIMGFSHVFHDLGIRASMSYATAVKRVHDQNFGSTDCSLPMVYALQHKLPVDAFVVMTDNETYAGHEHPAQALARYRKEMGIDAKLIVVGMTATEFSIADPKDPGMLDIVGFDANMPGLITDFIRD